MCIYIYIYMYVCIYIYVCICVYIYIYIHTHDTYKTVSRTTARRIQDEADGAAILRLGLRVDASARAATAPPPPPALGSEREG